MNKLTGDKKLDLLILMKLDDYDLGELCKVNKYTRSLCEDESFWLDRIKTYLGLSSNESLKIMKYLNMERSKELYIYLTNLLYLDDLTLFKICFENKYINKLCDENFWRKRAINIFGRKVFLHKPTDKSWKKYYIQIVFDTKETPNINIDINWEFFSEIQWNIKDQPEPENILDFTFEQISGKNLNKFYYLNLGKKIKIVFPFGSSEMSKVKKYTTEGYFSPEDIFQKVYDFYQKSLKKEQYEEWLESEPLGIYKIDSEKGKEGKLKRIDLFGEYASFLNFNKINNIFFLNITNEFDDELVN